MDINPVKNYETKEKELFKEVYDLSISGIPGVLNDNDFKTDYKSFDFQKNYINYFRQNKDNSNTKFYNKIDLGFLNEQKNLN